MDNREIDAQIAEWFFGRTVIRDWPFISDPECGGLDPWIEAEYDAVAAAFYSRAEWDEERKQTKAHYDHIEPCIVETGYRYLCPSYTTDPAASRALRQKLAERYPSMVLEYCRDDGPYTFTLWPEGCSVKCYEGTGATEELAVANAALLSVGVEVQPAGE